MNKKSVSLQKPAQPLKRFLCFLNFNHNMTHTSFENGAGKDFRYVYSCSCGKRIEKSHWTDDNHLLGYGSGSSLAE